MRKKKNTDILTDVELEFMSGLWELNAGTVREVLARLAPDRNLAYTSAATIMRILEQKGFVESRKENNALIYTPCLSKDAYRSRSLRHLSQKLFDDTPATLVARLVDDFDLSEEALDEIRALLDQRLADERR